MQRAQRQCIGTARARSFGQRCNASRVANSAIAAVTQCIDLRGDAPQARIRHRVIDRAAAARCNCQDDVAIIDQ